MTESATVTRPVRGGILGRLWVYQRAMYPLHTRLGVAAILVFEIYFVLLLNYGRHDFTIGIQEAVAVWTIFSFLLMLRAADDLKDYETDRRLFPHRVVPSGQVHRSDLGWLLGVTVVVTVVLNVLFMNNLPFFIALFAYGTLMSVWFFQRARIQKNLILAVITHNPVMMVMNIYVLSFAIIKYDLDPWTWQTILLAFTMYFPSLVWEVTRKIRAPRAETEYVTYSSIFGYRKATWFVLALCLIDVLTNLALIWALSVSGVVLLVINVAWVVWVCLDFAKFPNNFSLSKKVDRYIVQTELIMVLAVVAFLVVGRT